MRPSIVVAALALAAVAGSLRAQSPGAPLRLPVRYEADRFFVVPVLPGGDTLRFFTDTGGGLNMLFAPTATRLRLRADTVMGDEEPLAVVPFPEFTAAASIPAPTLPALTGARLAVLPMDGQLGALFPPDADGRPSADGFLGNGWFADRVWTFDYPARALWLRAAGDVPVVPPEHRVALGFREYRGGARGRSFPRIRVWVDGDSLDLLFDTGASTVLADSARNLLADGGPAVRATSFIAQSVLDGWRTRHPEWRVVERAERGTGRMMIEVPEVGVGGYRVGPVWFTARPDASFHQYMSQWMDRRVQGALGGSALKYLRVTMDYPRASASFEKP